MRAAPAATRVRLQRPSDRTAHPPSPLTAAAAVPSARVAEHAHAAPLTSNLNKPKPGGWRRNVLVRFREDDAHKTTAQPTPTSTAAAVGPAVPVLFRLHAHCAYGQAWGVVGSLSQLGGWDPERAVCMQWSPGDVWYALVHLPQGAQTQFKFVLVDGQAGNKFLGWANQVTGEQNLELDVQVGATVDHGMASALVARDTDAPEMASFLSSAATTSVPTAAAATSASSPGILQREQLSALAGTGLLDTLSHAASRAADATSAGLSTMRGADKFDMRLLDQPYDSLAQELPGSYTGNGWPSSSETQLQQHRFLPPLGPAVSEASVAEVTGREHDPAAASIDAPAREGPPQGPVYPNQPDPEHPTPDVRPKSKHMWYPHFWMQGVYSDAKEKRMAQRSANVRTPAPAPPETSPYADIPTAALSGEPGGSLGTPVEMVTAGPVTTPPPAATRTDTPWPTAAVSTSGAAPTSADAYADIPAAALSGDPGGSLGTPVEMVTAGPVTTPAPAARTDAPWPTAAGKTVDPATGGTTGSIPMDLGIGPSPAPPAMTGGDYLTGPEFITRPVEDLRTHEPTMTTTVPPSEAPTTAPSAAGVEVPVTPSTATAATLLSNMMGEEEVPMVPLSAGTHPLTGPAAEAAMNPRDNPIIMALRVTPLIDDASDGGREVRANVGIPEHREAGVESGVTSADHGHNLFTTTGHSLTLENQQQVTAAASDAGSALPSEGMEQVMSAQGEEQNTEVTSDKDTYSTFERSNS